MIVNLPARRLAKLAILALPLGLGAFLFPQSSGNLALAGIQTNPHVPDQVVVQFRAGVGENAKAAARSLFEASTVEVVLGESQRTDSDHKGDLELLRIPAGLDLATVIKSLDRDPAVEFAEPNWIYHHFSTSTDPYYTNGSLWGMYGSATSPSNQYGSGAGSAWAAGHTGSSSVYVGIIDEGIFFSHQDLAGQVFTNANDPVDGIDNDGDGYVDDIHGWDFNSNNNTIYDGAGDDHGTHVSGTIAARANNGTGVVGINWNIKLISAKFLGNSGGTLTNAVKACDYITNFKKNQGYNIVATNNSWGGGGYSQSLFDAIERANTQNILFVAAAGNGGSDGIGDNNDVIANYPSNYTNANVIAVAALTSTGAKASFSNYGATTVDLAAPGQTILSTIPGPNGQTSTYAYYSGTSMATPHVTGACALYLSTHPGSTAAQIKAAILGSTIATSSMSGKCVTGGRLNVSGF
ncbi:MAG: S8 family serine peptidase [Planctomycetes bacterium]|nr:S8 family serine peptidase [Planctomycetota bacterium]